MASKIWLLIFLLAVPAVGVLVAEGMQVRLNAQLREEAQRQSTFTKRQRLASLTVDSMCAEPNPDVPDLCAAQGRLYAMRFGAVVTGAAGLSLVLLIAAAGRVARGNRNVLLWAFKPGLYMTAAVLTVLILAHASILLAVLTGAIYFSKSALISRFLVGIILAVGLGALGGAAAVARNAFGVVKKAETLVLGNTVSRKIAPQLWSVIETSAGRLGALMPDAVVIGVDPNFFVTEAEVVTLNGRLSGRTLYCSMPLARILTIDELTAIIGHELGHFRGEDTKFSERFYPIYRGASDSLAGLQAAGGEGWGAGALLPAMGVFGFFIEAFAVAERRLGREREFVADQTGASVTNEAVMATSLVKVHAYAGLWDAVQQAVAAFTVRGRVFGNVSKPFADAIVQRATRAAIDGVLDSRSSHPTDSHPPLSERLDALKVTLESVAEAALSVTPQQTAAGLIPELEKREEEVSRAYQGLLAQHLGIDLHAAELEKRTSITRCAWCRAKVLPLANGACPSCGKPVSAAGPEQAGAV